MMQIPKTHKTGLISSGVKACEQLHIGVGSNLKSTLTPV